MSASLSYALWNRNWIGRCTLDDLANTNGNDEGTAADGAVEPIEESCQLSSRAEGVRMNILVTLVVRLGLVLDPAGVLDGDLFANLGRGAAALGDDGLLNTHYGLCERKVARLGKKGIDSSGCASNAEEGCRRERAHLEKEEASVELYTYST